MEKMRYYKFTGLFITITIAVFTSCSKTHVTEPVAPPVNPLRITSISPMKALATSQISIYGVNFDTVVAHNKVAIGGIIATVDSASSNEIVFTLPANAATGTIKLTSGNFTLTFPDVFTVITPYLLSQFTAGEFEHIAIDASGNIYGDDGNGGPYNVVNKATPAGVFSKFATVPDSSAYLYGTAVDKAGNVYEVNEKGINCIYKITPAGVVSILAGGSVNGYTNGKGAAAEFTSIHSLAIDAKGNLYTRDNHYIRKITPDGTVSTYAGSGVDGDADGPALSATFGSVEGIAVDAKGNVYAGDYKYYNIRKISPAGIVTTLAGNGNYGLINGKGSSAGFGELEGMTVDAAGNIFVSDYDGNGQNIRMVTPDGVVTTFLQGNLTSRPLVGTVPYASINLTICDGLAFDVSGNMYITSNLFQTINRLTFK